MSRTVKRVIKGSLLIFIAVSAIMFFFLTKEEFAEFAIWLGIAFGAVLLVAILILASHGFDNWTKNL